jgi:putative solute:sodium symporter small subunit
MTNLEDSGRAADARHWRRGRHVALLLTAVWVLITFVPPFFARDLAFDVFGAPFAVWVAAQGAPILYVVLVWVYERRMARLDREHRAGRVD